MRIIAVCLAILYGFAWGFVSLLIFRTGISIGEAGCIPPANSLISDYFPARSRAKAIAIFGVGLPLGGIAANLIGGPVTDAFSWRYAFILFGLPGIPVAILFWLTAREPPRGYSDEPGSSALVPEKLREAVQTLFRKNMARNPAPATSPFIDCFNPVFRQCPEIGEQANTLPH